MEASKIDTFKNRLSKALSMNNMKPADLVKITKIDKSLISNYLSGNYKAGQENLTILSEALGVSEPWLMGYNVALDSIKAQKEIFNNDLSLLEQYKVLFDKDHNLTDTQRKFLIDFLTEQHKKQDNESNN